MSRNVVLYIAMSLDGYIAKLDGSIDWLVGEDPNNIEDVGYNDFLKTIDTVIMGETTYEQVLTFGDYPYSNLTNYIYSNKDYSEASVISTTKDPEQLISELKVEPGKNIWVVGGSNLANQFIQKNLVDIYEIAIIPTIIGSGIKLFNELDFEIPLRLIDRNDINGITILKYMKRN